ncbi:MAG: hypothetical protein U5K74_08885 [Gemmatimonadaceae bacterium]|nr:hypothetical protein [Gemmatimonadaceae bacterium]
MAVVVYNGEVLSPQLMAGLQAGVALRYRIPLRAPETVLRSYARNRQEPSSSAVAVAIAIWDRADRTLTLARDRFGVKPLYYVHASDGTLYFASEIKALIAAGAVTAELHMGSVRTLWAKPGRERRRDLVCRGQAARTRDALVLWRDGW